MKKTIRLSCGILAAMGWASSARADLAAPHDYESEVSGNAVTVSLRNQDGRTCPDPDGMLRENTSTHEVVKLADFCGPMDANQLPSYVDECVPPGVYRYGLATPYDCRPFFSGYCDSFTEVTVETAVGDCTLSNGNPGVTAASCVPWGGQSETCSDDPKDDPNDPKGNGGGCSTAPSGAGTVLTIDILALTAGAVFLRRARSSRSRT